MSLVRIAFARFCHGLALSVVIGGVAACSTSTPTSTPASSPTIPPTRAATVTIAPPSTPTPVSVTATPPTVSDWTTYHRDNLRTGYLSNMPDPQRLTMDWNTDLDGAVYAEPLVIGAHVIVATEGDSVYSLDAHSGKVEWRAHVGEPVPRSALPCGNINPLGITGTPVYDPGSGLVFAVAEVTGPSHVLVGIDVKTGDVRVRRSADPAGMEPLAHQQRAALALSQGMVYIAFGGLFGDCGNYQGRVVASRTDGTGELLAFQVPTQREGGIWAPAGPAIDAAGKIYVSVGNGSEVAGNWDQSDSVLRLSSALKLEDSFAPEQWRQDNATDADLGSLSPVMLTNGLIFIAGKSGIGYVLRAGALGGVGGQVQMKSTCHAYGGAAVVGSVIFIPCNEGVQQIQISADGNINLGWRADGIPGSPLVGGRTVYTLDRNGTLHALDSGTGKARATIRVGTTSRFATPTLFENRIFVGTMTGVVSVVTS